MGISINGNKPAVAILGFGPRTRDGVWDAVGRVDAIWSMNYFHRYKFPPVDLVFELHTVDYLLSPAHNFADHVAWMERNREIPIFMQERHPRFPMSRRYPMEEVLADIHANVFRLAGPGDMPLLEPVYFQTSTISWALALAIHEGYRRIELYGIDLDSDTEYRYQRDAVSYALGVAAGRGVEIIIPRRSSVMNANLYGYEREGMISRQTLELYRGQLKNQLNRELAKANRFNGEYISLVKKAQALAPGEEQDRIIAKANEVQARVQAAVSLAHTISGGVQVVEKLIAEIDMEKPDIKLQTKIIADRVAINPQGEETKAAAPEAE